MTAGHLAAFAVRIYQYSIGLVVPPACRFHPSCSAYAVEALRTHGLLRGGALAAWRILRCHPWNAGGVDPVPQRTRH
jgi:putative membrane protein insertion efficiency factor